MKLALKLLLFFISAAIVLTWAVLFFSRKTIHTVLVQEATKAGVAQSRSVARDLARALRSTKEELKILTFLQTAKEQLRAEYAVVLDRKGEVLAHSNVAERGKVYWDPPTREALLSRTPAAHETKMENKPILEVSIPIYEEEELLFASGQPWDDARLGTLQIGIPMEENLRIESRILNRQIAFLSGGILTLSAVLIFFIWTNVVLPARRLAESIKRISSGCYGDELPVASSDELGSLTEDFNFMSKTLEETTVSKNFLQESEGRYRRLADLTSDAIYIHDRKGRILDVNQTACTSLGYTREELLSMDVKDLEQDFSQENLEAVWSSLLAGKIIPLQGAHKRKDGTTFPMEVRIGIIDPKGDGLILASVRDTSDRKALQERLLQSEKLSAVGQLAAGVAHELNNPLGIILGFAQGAVKRIAQDSHLSMPLKSIEREAIRCKDLVQNLLLFSRQKKQGSVLFELKGALESALSLVATQARVRSVELRADILIGSLRLQGNESELQQVVINLCSNAIDAMPDGGILTVRLLERIDDGKACAVLSVSDTGMGIPDHVRGKVFDPFFTTKEPGKGTGLGLSLSYEIVHKHSGVIDCESEVGKGTTFTVTLPAVRSEARA